MFGSKSKKQNNNNEPLYEEKPDIPYVELNTVSLKSILSKSYDVKFRGMLINDNKNLPVTLVYIDGLVNASFISDYILKPLIQENKFKQADNLKDALELMENGDIYFSSQFLTEDINKAVSGVLTGSTALIFDDLKTAVIFDTKGFEKRAITEPSIENVIKSSKDTFVETLMVNTASVRRKIKSPNLVIEQTVVGKQSLTPVAIVYLSNTANSNLVDELKKRIDSINVDNVIASGFIEEYISDNINSLFPQVLSTERPGKLSADIIEGRVGIIIDGLPIAFIVPGTLAQFLQAPEDYSHNYIISSLIRFMRYILMFLTLTLPGVYVAIVTFHQEMLPTPLAIAIAKSREGVTFPTSVETMLMLIAFEMLFEANLRIPKATGQAISFIGAIVIGEAAVEAKIISADIVVVIAVTVTAAFVVLNQDLIYSFRIWRIIFTIAGAILGLFGLVLSIIFFTYGLCKLESFGVPYLSPLVSADGDKQLIDTLFRFPLKFHITRPGDLNVKNKKRQGD